jgi:NifU-like protein involved in Fe-S cluster formation
MTNYNSNVMDHFFNPRNPGEVENPSGEGFSGSPEGRLYMHVTMRVERDRITDIRFQCYTCVVAVAAMSFLTESVKGKTLALAESITPESLARDLGEIPPERMDRCELAVEALKNALADYRKKQG